MRPGGEHTSPVVRLTSRRALDLFILHSIGQIHSILCISRGQQSSNRSRKETSPRLVWATGTVGSEHWWRDPRWNVCSSPRQGSRRATSPRLLAWISTSALDSFSISMSQWFFGCAGETSVLASLDIVRWTSYWSWLYILKLRWMSPFETKIKTDIPRFQHVDFWCFRLILTIFGLILVNVGQ